MSSMQSVPDPVWTRLLDHKLECPACHQSLEVLIRVLIKDVSVRRTGGNTFRSNFAATAATQAQEMKIEHHCTIEAADD